MGGSPPGMRPMPNRPRCHYCPNEATTRDHIVPRVKVRLLDLPGGHPFHVINVVPACRGCNRKKGQRKTECVCLGCVHAWREYQFLCGATLRRTSDA